ncbi:MAG: PqqD family protein [Lachnospiraceae bacterium]|nr:PqqD family protein [Lachnospiraceae bacterium]
MDTNDIYRKNMEITLEKLDGKFYIAYDYSAYEVNEVGARIIDLCNGQNSVSDIADKLSKHFNVEYEKVLNDVISYITILTDKSFVNKCG